MGPEQEAEFRGRRAQRLRGRRLGDRRQAPAICPSRGPMDGWWGGGGVSWGVKRPLRIIVCAFGWCGTAWINSVDDK